MLGSIYPREGGIGEIINYPQHLADRSETGWVTVQVWQRAGIALLLIGAGEEEGVWLTPTAAYYVYRTFAVNKHSYDIDWCRQEPWPDWFNSLYN